jgi:glycosyltransferase involved in cell wall biosynthesis
MPNSSARFNHALAEQLIQQHTVEYRDNALCKKPVISVIVHTYNHAPFLTLALEGILSQKVNCPIEIIIGDDCSQDGAQLIAKRYQKQYPELIRLFISTQNLGQYTGGGRLNILRSFQACRGKYIAYLEGDDFWTDSDKLQKQFDYMQNDFKTSGCFHDGMRVNERGEILARSYNNEYKASYAQRACLIELRTSYPSASLFFRSDIIRSDLPEYYLREGSDFLLDLVITEHGSLDYLPFIGCAYRVHDGGSYSSMSVTQRSVRCLYRYSALLHDSIMRGRYQIEINKSINQTFFDLCLAIKQQGEVSFLSRLSLLSLKTPKPKNVIRLLLFIKAEILYNCVVFKAVMIGFLIKRMNKIT